MDESDAKSETPRVDDDVAEELSLKDISSWERIVAIEKTPERIALRKRAIAMAYISSIITIVFLLAWSTDYYVHFHTGNEIVDSIVNPVQTGISYFDVYSISSNTILMVAFVLAMILSILGFLSPMYSGCGGIFAMLVASQSFSFEGTYQMNSLVSLDAEYIMTDPVNMVVSFIIPLVTMLLGLTSTCLMGKSISRNMSVRDNNTGIPWLGLKYMTDKWNIVARRRPRKERKES